MQGRLLHCLQCNELVSLNEFDFYPEYIWDWDKGELIETEVNDRETFIKRHEGHNIEELIQQTPITSSEPYIEPVKTSYFEAMNGNKKFLIKRWRKSIDVPLTYEIIPGYLFITTTQIEIQTKNICRQLRTEIGSSSLSEKKIDQFIEIIREVVSNADLTKMEVSSEGETDLISYYKLDDETIKRILKMSEEIFKEEELNQIKRFILSNNDLNDPLTLRVTRRFEIKDFPRDRDSKRSKKECKKKICLHHEFV